MTAQKTSSQKLLDALWARYSETSRSKVKRWILQGKVIVNGTVNTRPHHLVKESDSIEYHARSRSACNLGHAPYPVHYEDPHLIIVDKPAGILSYGKMGSGGTSVYKRLTEFLKTRQGKPEKIFVVHRLDREVSGILVFAKSEEVQQSLKARWKEVAKTYLALVEGSVQRDQGTIKTFLKEGPDQKVYSTKDEEGSRIAITHYRVLKRLRGLTLVEIRLDTGRKNQIRVHLSEMGHPVVGDYRYGADSSVKRRIRLHAFYLELTHPVTGKKIAVTSARPRGFLTPGHRDENYK